jgi:hypothetical protein
MAAKSSPAIAVIGIDIGKTSFHVVGLDEGARSSCARSGRADRWRPAWPTCRRVSSACDF